MVSLAVPFLDYRLTGEPMDAWLTRHESKLFYGLFAAFLLFVYFMGSVECANYGNCWFTNADLANTVFRFFGLK